MTKEDLIEMNTKIMKTERDRDLLSELGSKDLESLAFCSRDWIEQERKMNRKELAKELNVWPWDVDDWLLLGCPAKKIRNGWEFDLEKVKIWLAVEKIRIKRIKPQRSFIRPIFDQRWFKGRCPICIDRGFPGEKAGRVYTLGEVSEGRWHIRRTGIPCGHSMYFSDGKNGNSLNPRIRRKMDLL